MTRHTHANQSPLKELSVDAIVELLRGNGMRVTKNRLQILDTLLRAELLKEVEKPEFRKLWQGPNARKANGFDAIMAGADEVDSAVPATIAC